jgi:hypothetical protein
MPCPPLKMTKSDYKERINFLEQMFESGNYDEKPEELRKMFLREIEEGIPTEAPDVLLEADMENEGCPIFGHYCPGGKEQAEICRSED